MPQDKVKELLDLMESSPDFKGAYTYESLSADLSDKNKSKELYDLLETDDDFKGAYKSPEDLMALKKKPISFGSELPYGKTTFNAPSPSIKNTSPSKSVSPLPIEEVTKKAAKELTPETMDVPVAAVPAIKAERQAEKDLELKKQMVYNDMRYARLLDKQQAKERGYEKVDDYYKDRETYLINNFLTDDDKEEARAQNAFAEAKKIGNEALAAEELQNLLNTKAKFRQTINAEKQALDSEEEQLKQSLESGMPQEQFDGAMKVLANKRATLDLMTKPYYDPKKSMNDFLQGNVTEVAAVSKPSQTTKEKLQEYTNALYTQLNIMRDDLGWDADNGALDAYAKDFQLRRDGKGELVDKMYETELKLRNAVKILELNRTPIDNETALGVFGKSFATSLNPASASKQNTEQIVAQNLQSINEDAGISEAVDKEQKKFAEENAKEYKPYSAKWFAQPAGTSAAIMLEFIPASMATEGAFALTKIGRLVNIAEQYGKVKGLNTTQKYINAINKYKTLKAADTIGKFALKTQANGLKFGTTSEMVAQLFPKDADEVNFTTGYFGGQIGKGAEQLLGGAATSLYKLFGNKAPEAVKAIERLGEQFKFAKDAPKVILGEIGEEFGESLGQIYKESDSWKEISAKLDEQFGTLDKATQFVIQTGIMALGMGGGTAVGANLMKSSKDAYNKLSREQRAIVDEVLDSVSEEETKVVEDATKEVSEELKKEVPQVKEQIIAISPKLDNGVSIGLFINSKGVTINERQVPSYKKLGYSDEDINNFSEKEAQQIYLNQIENPNIENKANITNELQQPSEVNRTIDDFANENESYRVIVGDEAFNDIVESGVVRTNAKSKPKTGGGIDLSNRPTLFPSFSRGKASIEYANNNPNNYIIVTEDSSIQPSTKGRHGKGSTMFPTDLQGNPMEELSGEKIKVYKHVGEGKYELVYENGKVVAPKETKTEVSLQPEGESKLISDALKDVERTTKALNDLGEVVVSKILSPQQINDINKSLYDALDVRRKELISSGVKSIDDINADSEYASIKEQITKTEGALKNTPAAISEAYHKAKLDGSNPELVKAVEDLLSESKEETKSEAGSVGVGEGVFEKGNKIQWNVFGNEESGEWTVGETTKTRGGKDAVVLAKVYVEASSDGKIYTKEYADANGIKYDNESTVEHIVPLEDLQSLKETPKAEITKTEPVKSETKPTTEKPQLTTEERIANLEKELEKAKSKSLKNELQSLIEKEKSEAALKMTEDEFVSKGLGTADDYKNLKSKGVVYERTKKPQKSKFTPNKSQSLKDKRDAIIAKLKQVFPNIGVSFDEKEFNDVSEKQSATGISSGGKVYAVLYEGKIYINPNEINLEAPIHEFAHIWVDIAKNKYREFYKNLVNAMDGTPYFEAAKEAYPELSKAKQLEEAAVQAIADKGALLHEKEVNKGIIQKVLDAVKKLGNTVLSGLGIKNNVNFLDMTWSDLVNKAASDLMAGKPISYVTSEEVDNIDQDAYGISIEGGLLKQGKTGVDSFVNKISGKRYEGLIPFLREMFKVGGNYPNIRNMDSKRIQNISAYLKQIEGVVHDFRLAVKAYNKNHTEQEVNKAIQAIRQYLVGSVDANAILEVPEELRPIAMTMRNNVDGLSQLLLDSGFIDQKSDLYATISSNLGIYMNRSYAAFVDPEWNKMMFPDSKVRTKAMERAYVDAYRYIQERYNNFVEIDGQLYTLKTDRNGNITAMYDASENLVTDKDLQKQIGEAYNNKEKITPDEINNTLMEFARANKDVMRGNGGRIGKMDLGLFKERKDIAPALRAFLGEYTSPEAMYIQSMRKMAQYVENQKFLNNLKEFGMGKVFFKEATGDYNVKIPGTSEYSPIKGLYTSPQVLATLDANIATKKDAAWYMNVFYYANFLTKFGKTGLSFKSQVRNFLSNIGIGLANGYYNPFMRGDSTQKPSQAFKLAYSELTKKGGNVLAELARRGVLETSAIGKDLENVVKATFGEDLTFDDERGVMDRIFKSVPTALRKAGMAASDLYKLGDNVHKIFNFYTELQQVKHMFPKLSEDEQMDIAESRFKMTNVIYDKTPGIIQLLRVNPLISSFPSFRAEMIRISWNIPALAIRDITEGKKNKNLDQVAIGINRLASYSVVVTLLPALAWAISKGSGMDDDDEQLLYQTAPDYAKNTAKIVLEKPTPTSYNILDFSWQNPFSFSQEAYNAYSNSKAFDKESSAVAIGRSVLEVIKPFTTEEINVRIMINLAKNDDGTGRKIYNPEDTDKATDVVAYVLKQMRPGIATEAENLYKGAIEREEGGRKYDLQTELASELTGSKVYKLDAVTKLRSLSSKYRKLFDDDYKIYSAVKYQKTNDPDYEKELSEAYEKANYIYRKRQEEIMNYVQTLKRKGVTDKEILENLKAVGGQYDKDLPYYILKGFVTDLEK